MAVCSMPPTILYRFKNRYHSDVYVLLCDFWFGFQCLFVFSGPWGCLGTGSESRTEEFCAPMEADFIVVIFSGHHVLCFFLGSVLGRSVRIWSSQQERWLIWCWGLGLSIRCFIIIIWIGQLSVDLFGGVSWIILKRFTPFADLGLWNILGFLPDVYVSEKVLPIKNLQT